MDFRRSASPSTVSPHASHPQAGKAVRYHRPKRAWSPGNAEKTMTSGAADEFVGVSLTLGPASSERASSSESRSCPSSRATSNRLDNWSSNSAAMLWREANLPGFVTRVWGSLIDYELGARRFILPNFKTVTSTQTESAVKDRSCEWFRTPHPLFLCREFRSSCDSGD